MSHEDSVAAEDHASHKSIRECLAKRHRPVTDAELTFLLRIDAKLVIAFKADPGG
jgi:hypothetical protein